MDTDKPYVWVSPGRKGGAPCVGGTRIPTEAVARFVHSLGIAETRTAYPHLTRPDVLVACWYEAVHGGKRWRRRWGAWAKKHVEALWTGTWADVTDPPGEVQP